MTPEQIAALEKTAAEAKAKADATPQDESLKKAAQDAADAVTKAKAPSQNPVKKALEDEQRKGTYSEKEKAAFNFKKNAEKLKELGEDPKSILGISSEEGDDGSEVPEWYKREKARDAQKTSLQLADSISDEDERNLTKLYLQQRIVPSGNAEEDFRLAYAAVSALKNKQIAEEVSRKSGVKVTAAGGSANAADTGEKFEPTPQEAYMMRSFGLSEAKIIAARKREEARQR